MASQIKPPEMPAFQLRERKQKKPLRGINRRGKAVTLWETIRKALKIRFRRVGITSCEIKLPQCWKDGCLAFCHTKRRADCSESDLWRVVLGCAACATALNGMNKHKEEKILEGIINKRAVQP